MFNLIIFIQESFQIKKIHAATSILIYANG